MKITLLGLYSLDLMSTSRYSPTESSYWSSPRLKIPIKAVNLDLNHNVAVSQATAPSKSLSEPSSPQLWHKGTKHFLSFVGCESVKTESNAY